MPKHTTPPGPKGSLIRGVLGPFLDSPLDLLAESAARYGDIVALRFLHRTVYLLNHPDYIKHVLVDNNQSYAKGRGLAATKPVIGEGLLTSEGDFHLRQRRLVQPAFHRRRITAFADIMVQQAAGHIAAWRDGQTLDLHQEIMRLTMTIVTQTLFGVDVTTTNKPLTDALDALMVEFTVFDMTPLGQLWAKLPTARRRRRDALLKTLNQAIYGFIEAGHSRPTAQENLLTMLLAAQDDEGDGTGMTDQQVRDEVMTLFIAGHETTANAISWAFYLLAQNPAVEAKLKTELDTVLAGRLPTIEDVPALAYTRLVFSEALRLYPPAWTMGRLALADDEIGGYHVPAGTTVLASQWVMHRHPRYWDEPTQCRPERFQAGDEMALRRRLRFVYFPFGGGPRLCIGEQFAWLEGILLIATLAQRFHVRLSPNARIEPEPKITLRLKYGLPVTLLERQPEPNTTLAVPATPNGVAERVLKSGTR